MTDLSDRMADSLEKLAQYLREGGSVESAIDSLNDDLDEWDEELANAELDDLEEEDD